MSTAHRQYSRKFAAIFTVLALVLALFPVAALAQEQPKFSDIAGLKLAKEIEEAANAGLVDGYPDGTFRPKENVTRAQFAKMIVNAVEKATGTTLEKGDEPFSDVTEDQELYEFVVKAYKAGYIKGYEDGTFGYDKPIVREEAAAILQRALKLQEAEENFDDVSSSQRLAGAIGAVAKAGIMTGYDAKRFGPRDNVQRDQAAAVAVRAYNYLLQQEPAKLAVESVKVANAKQIVVVFNKGVDKSSAQNVGNYSIKIARDNQETQLTSNDARAVVGDDGRTVTVTLAKDLGDSTAWKLKQGDAFVFTVSGVKDTKGNTVDKTSVTLVYKDDVAPKLLAASAVAQKTTKTVTLTFSEPVNADVTGVFQVDGQTAAPKAATFGSQVVLTTSQALEVGKSYTVTVINVKDYAGNAIDPNPSTLTFTVAEDSTAPTVKNVSVDGDDTIVIEFSEAMESSTVTAAGNIKVLNAVGADLTASATVGRVTDTTYAVKVQNTSIFANSNTATLTVVLTSNIKDAAGNAFAGGTASVTLTKDTVKPTIQAVQYVAPGSTYDNQTWSNGAFVVTLSEAVVAPAATALSNVIVVDQSGQQIGASQLNWGTPKLKSDNPSVVILPLGSKLSSSVQSVTISFPPGVFVDDSNGRNGNEAKVVSGVTAVDTAEPEITVQPQGTGAANGENTVTYNVKDANLDLATVLDVNNYRLDGKPLPGNAYITGAHQADGSFQVVVHLPRNTVDETREYGFTVTGIKDKAGNVADPIVTKVSLVDNTQPVLNSGTINSDGSVTLKFTEAVKNAAATDFIVTLNGKTLPSGSLEVAPGQGSEVGSVLVKIKVALADGAGTDGKDVIYVEVDGTSGYSASADLKIAEGTFDSAADYNGGYVRSGDITSLTVKMVASPATTDSQGNNAQADTLVTVK